MDEIKELKEIMLNGFQQLNQRMDGMEQRMDGIEQRMDGIEQRMGGMEQRMDGMEQRMDGMEQRMGGMESRLTGLEVAVVELKESQTRMENDMNRNFGALYDSRELQIDANEKIICAVTRIESKLERADLRALYATNKLARA